ncbi:MAG: carbamoyl-phosphate synthase large subunit [Aigarchaeota archaeon]|nr:carbamoyl-phosphate synthase large subunit [Aigarchaeota archaeon]MDW8092126.1 carbamoyl-phosphate synthase large subunit [Nitrososphaerota archaeon]
MPIDRSIKKVLVIGSGPITIGQAAEFDYSGSQACKALREEGVEVVVVNSNPATIQTDTDIADIVYIEPLTPEIIAEIIRRERPDGLLATMGGQTGLNITVKLDEMGVLQEVGTRVIGTPVKTIKLAEDRKLFYDLVRGLGEPIPKSITVTSLTEAEEAVKELGGYPVLCRPSYMLGGGGSGVAYNRDELISIVNRGLAVSLNNTVAIDEYLDGWKEFEYEIIRDSADNCISVCNMENLDPLGIHTGESIVVTPAQTLTDEEHQRLREVAFKIVRALGVVGACNIQFAVNLEKFEYSVIEVNPRVSRSSALASKATGYPIARVAAKIALGLRLDEIMNNVTKKTTAAFEPSIDYVVVKIPRWPFDIFPNADRTIGTQMKSTGETMAIGRTFEEALQKAVRSLDIGRYGLASDGREPKIDDLNRLIEGLKVPSDLRLFYLYEALKRGVSSEEIHRLTKIDKWFIRKIENILKMERKLRGQSLDSTNAVELIREAKKLGFSDYQLGHLMNATEEEVRAFRIKYGILPVYKMVDTCAGEFEAATPYYYSSYEDYDECRVTSNKKVIILGGGPIRIGQGIEFDYCSVHAVITLKSIGYEAIVINNNPETVSTDFDVSDKLYFEPLTFEDVMNVIEKERPIGVVVQLGGQTPINLVSKLARAGVHVLGTPPVSIDIAEDRGRFNEFLRRLNILQPPGGAARSIDEALEIARKVGFPVLVRPSYVLGGKAMKIVSSEEELKRIVEKATVVSEGYPVLIDKFLYPAIEVDVDAVSDGKRTFIAGILEHIEVAGVHSGDAAMVIPPQSLPQEVIDSIKDYTIRISKELRVLGLVNIQFAVYEGKVFVLEVNPRASRTVPFVSKAISIPLAKVGTLITLGYTLDELGIPKEVPLQYVAVKESVFSFSRLVGVDPILEPVMKSTGEVMGIDEDFPLAYLKAEMAAGMHIPSGGRVLIHASSEMIQDANYLVKWFADSGFEVMVTRSLEKVSGIANLVVVPESILSNEVEAARYIRSNNVRMVVNLAPIGDVKAQENGYVLRRAAVITSTPYMTTLMGVLACIKSISKLKDHRIKVKSINEYHQVVKGLLRS